MNLKSLITLNFAIFIVADAAKILVISPNLANSMVLYAGRMADVLERAGHNVTLFIPEMRSSTNKMNATKLAKVIRMENLGGHFDAIMTGYSDPFQPFHESVWRRRDELVAMTKNCEAILKRFHELHHLRREQFDLAITNHVDFCDLSLVHSLGIPLHVWTTTGPIMDINSWAIGIPSETSYIPVPWENRSGPVMNLWQRMWNLLHLWIDRLVVYEHLWRINNLFRHYIDPAFPGAFELASNSALLFVNADEFLEPTRSVPSKVIHIGGVGLKQPESLSGTSFARFQNTTRPLILFSLGSSASTLYIKEKTKKAILDAFSHFPQYEFIVKVDREDELFMRLGREVANAHVFDWVPQRSLLAHPKMRLFITHTGYNSLIESTISGVPMLALPLFFDQHRNARAMEYRGVARVLEPHRVNIKTMKRELELMLSDESYTKNARRFAHLHRIKPNQPDETLVKWINFVLESGPLPEARPELLNLSFFCSSNLDIHLIFFLFLIFSFLTLKFLLKRFVFGGKEMKEKEKRN